MIPILIALVCFCVPFGMSLCFISGYLDILGYFDLNDSRSVTAVFLMVMIGFLTYVITTGIALIDCDKRDIPPAEKLFWRTVLIKCFYTLCAVPVYYMVVRKPAEKKSGNSSLNSVNHKYGNLAYVSLRIELITVLSLLVLSLATAGLALVYPGFIEIPVIIFKIGIFSMSLFPTFIFLLYLFMLYEFAQRNRDVADVIYYFGQKHWVFGVIKYYKVMRITEETGSEHHGTSGRP